MEKKLEFFLYRVLYNERFTVGRLFFKKDRYVHSLCDTLEPPCRKSDSSESKSDEKTATPSGSYKLVPGFNKVSLYCPKLIDVPQHKGVFIQIGSSFDETSGSILVGEYDHVGKLSHSAWFFSKISHLFLNSRKAGYSCSIRIIENIIETSDN